MYRVLSLAILCVGLLNTTPVFASLDDGDPEMFKDCLKDAKACQKGADEFHEKNTYRSEAFLHIGCEDHQNSAMCVELAVLMGKRGHDEVGVGYLKMACRLDKFACKALEFVQCHKKTGGDPECGRDNPFVKKTEDSP